MTDETLTAQTQTIHGHIKGLEMPACILGGEISPIKICA
jgi:hypothetical protein